MEGGREERTRNIGTSTKPHEPRKHTRIQCQSIYVEIAGTTGVTEECVSIRAKQRAKQRAKGEERIQHLWHLWHLWLLPPQQHLKDKEFEYSHLHVLR